MSLSIAALIVGSLLALSATTGVAAARPQGGHASIRGLIPSEPSAGVHAAAGAGNLRYHGGPVMHASRTFAIYWQPGGNSKSMAAGYVRTINRFFKDVAAASGRPSNVYFSDTEYFDWSGPLVYSSQFGGSTVDTSRLPKGACPARGRRFTHACLTQAQVEAEIDKVMRAKGWAPGTDTACFLFLAKGVGSCVQRSLCAFTEYCGYHTNFEAGAGPVIYSLLPYPFADGRCDDGAQRGLEPQHPNGNLADATINAVSHEHNEAITDPLGDGWWDALGNENGDKCLYRFGRPLGRTHTGLYNQRIGTGRYYLQGEWSNERRGCVLTGR